MTRIRDAVGADWPGIWAVLKPIVVVGETYTMPPEMSSAQAREFWLAPEAHVFVAEVDGRIAGSAKLRPNQPGPGAHVANASFIVAGEQSGRGIGRTLAEHVLAAARDQGYRAMQFNAVVETNTAAVALWRSLGFGILATVPNAFAHPRHGLVGLHIMHRSL